MISSALNVSRRLLLVGSIALLLSSCATLNCSRLEQMLGGDTNLITLGNKISDDLTTTAMPPLMPRHPQNSILVATFVDLNRLESTSKMGRLLQSHIGARLVQRGYTVKEVNLRDTLKIEQGSGEVMLSRDLSLIRPEQSVQAILLGTYSMTNRTLYLTAKLINPLTRNVISAQSYKICMDDTLLAMFGIKRRVPDPSTRITPPSGSLINRIFF